MQLSRALETAVLGATAATTPVTPRAVATIADRRPLAGGMPGKVDGLLIASALPDTGQEHRITL